MVNWSDPDEVAKDADVLHKLVFALFGAYIWELFTTCDFEWSLLTKRRKFRLPLILFFLCRYCMLLSFVGLIISISATKEINCKALYTFNSWTGNTAILCASSSLMLRTFALWERRLSVVIPLGILCVAHWALLYRTMFIVVAQWDSQAKACVVVQTNPSLLNITFFFTMGFDLVILISTAAALLARHSVRTDLWNLLFQDGLVYFIVSFSTNCIPAVLNILNLNTPMNVIATIPAAAVTSTAACRAVMRLLEFSSGDVYVHSFSVGTTGSNPPITIAHHNVLPHLKPQRGARSRAEVRVTTEHITMTEYLTSGTNSPFLTIERSSRTSIDIESARHKDREAFAERDDATSFVYNED